MARKKHRFYKFIGILIIIVAIIFLAIFWDSIENGTRITSIIGILGIIAAVYIVYQPKTISKKDKEDDIKQTDKEYMDRIKYTKDISQIRNDLAMKAQEISVYFTSALSTSNIKTDARKKIKDAIDLYEQGQFSSSIVTVGVALEASVNETIARLNASHKIKLSGARQKQLSLYQKIIHLFINKKLSDTDLNKLNIIRKYRNMNAHAASKQEMLVDSNNARLVIELGIELIEKIQNL